MGSFALMQLNLENNREMVTQTKQNERRRNHGTISSEWRILCKRTQGNQSLQNIPTCFSHIRYIDIQWTGNSRLGKKGKEERGKEINLGMAGTTAANVIEVMEKNTHKFSTGWMHRTSARRLARAASSAIRMVPGLSTKYLVSPYKWHMGAA